MKKILLSTIVILLTAATGAWAQTSTDIVTKNNFYSYFDDNGNLLDAITSDKLIFQGEFSDLVDYIVLNRSITITGDNAVLKNMGIAIVSKDVAIDNLTLTANTSLDDLIYVSGSDVSLDKISVTYNAPIEEEEEAKAIFANDAENFSLTNSEIIFTGANPGGNHYRGLEVRDCDAAIIDNNTITATFPAVDVSWDGYGSISQNLVLAVGIQGGNDVEFTNNIVNVNTNGEVGSYPTIDAVMVYSANNILINGNNITVLDTTKGDNARYYYSLDIYSTKGTVEGNNIIVNTTTAAGVDRAGSAYSIQLTGPFTITVKDNNITAISKGSVTAIYTSNWGGEAILTVENNNIDVTGDVTTSNYALVSGIEAQIDEFYAYNNTIAVNNGADYDDANQVIGVGIGYSYYGDTSADIQGNDMTVDGKYAVYYEKASYTNVIGNALRAHELTGDAAVYIGAGEENVVKNNVDAFNSITTGVKSVENSNADVNTYSVTGVRVNTPSHLPKGIYIIGGKKVIVK